MRYVALIATLSLLGGASAVGCGGGSSFGGGAGTGGSASDAGGATSGPPLHGDWSRCVRLVQPLANGRATLFDWHHSDLLK
jgi:hypothetical protein